TGVVEDQELGESSGEERRDTAFAVQVDFTGDKWWLRGEVGTVDQEEEVEATGGYFEAAYFVTDTLQLAARFEYQETDILEFEIPREFDDLGRHEDLSVGVGWWFHPSWVAKAAVHQVHGNRFAIPESLFEGELNEPPDSDTRLIELGIQFSF
ncbi:MAG: hypothetical protein AAFY88_04405, partial [Acidobacteriota bacterium]